MGISFVVRLDTCCSMQKLILPDYSTRGYGVTFKKRNKAIGSFRVLHRDENAARNICMALVA